MGFITSEPPPGCQPLAGRSCGSAKHLDEKELYRLARDLHRRTLRPRGQSIESRRREVGLIHIGLLAYNAQTVPDIFEALDRIGAGELVDPAQSVSWSHSNVVLE